MVLILDVARFKYPPHWVPLEVLYEAMQVFIHIHIYMYIYVYIHIYVSLYIYKYIYTSSSI
jgi:hypothetical protein